MKADSGLEELEEVQQELKEKDEERERSSGDIESQGPVRASQKIKGCFSAIFLQGSVLAYQNVQISVYSTFRIFMNLFSFHDDIFGGMGRSQSADNYNFGRA